MHVGRLFEVGKVVVRPSCKTPLVLVGGTCVENCPRTKIPIAGACQHDPHAQAPEERQALMIPIRIDNTQDRYDYANAPSDDSKRLYFKYRFVYDLAGLLNCDSKRIIISSLSNGSVIVNTIFKPAITEADPLTLTDERSPLGLVELFRSLQNDTSSAMYEADSLFKDIDRSLVPPAIKIRVCDSDGEWRIFCPFVEADIMSTLTTQLWYWVGLLIVALSLACLCGGCWMIDHERADPIDAEDVIDKLNRDPRLVEPELRVEFARSWLEGRFMGERWEKARQNHLLAIE